jgi:hypothetical protein
MVIFLIGACLDDNVYSSSKLDLPAHGEAKYRNSKDKNA